MIIGISGKARSGKDLVGQIIQYLIYCDENKDNKNVYYPVEEWYVELTEGRLEIDPIKTKSGWVIKKFAFKVKQITSLLTGIPLVDLEKEEVKNSTLPECWNIYEYVTGFVRDMDGNPLMNWSKCSKEKYEQERITNWQTARTYKMTVREFMYKLATDCIRDSLGIDTWVNGLFADYISRKDYIINNARRKGLKRYNLSGDPCDWIITDLRFENEAVAIKARDGITIRVERSLENRHPDEWWNFITTFPLADPSEFNFMEHCFIKYPKLANHLTHQSEIELDKYVGTDYFNYTVTNNDSIEDLVQQVKDILKHSKIII